MALRRPSGPLYTGRMTNAAPFWKTKTLEEMTPEEWESLCDGCGRCCTAKIEAASTHKVYWTDVACWVMDRRSCKCGDYANRESLVPWCHKMDAAHVRRATWLPTSCGYRRVRDGRDLAWWHPLISGDPETVHQAGISVRGRVVSDLLAGPVEHHAIVWQEFDTDDPAGLPMHQRALFGGVNVALPTPFLAGGDVDCDRLVKHCLWLLARGCDGLVLFAGAGEGAALTAEVRLHVTETLVGSKVPVSRLWPVFDAGDRGTKAALTSLAARGMRGAMLASADGCSAMTRLLSDPALPLLYPILAPGDDPAALLDLARAIGERLPGFFLPGAGAAAVAQARAALAGTGLCGQGPEIYVDAGGFGAASLSAGAAGVITPLANIAGQLLARLRGGTASDPAASAARLAALVDALAGYDEAAATKALLARAWRDPEWERPAPGGLGFDPAEKAKLFAAVDAAAR